MTGLVAFAGRAQVLCPLTPDYGFFRVVLERTDTVRRGKGFALEYGFEHVLRDPSVDACLVVDADTTVQPDFLVAMAAAFAGGADGVQCRYLVSNADEHRHEVRRPTRACDETRLMHRACNLVGDNEGVEEGDLGKREWTSGCDSV